MQSTMLRSLYDMCNNVRPRCTSQINLSLCSSRRSFATHYHHLHQEGNDLKKRSTEVSKYRWRLPGESKQINSSFPHAEDAKLNNTVKIALGAQVPLTVATILYLSDLDIPFF